MLERFAQHAGDDEAMVAARSSPGDTPAKLATFVYAFLHLEIDGYELLKRTVQRAGVAQRVTISEQIIREKRSAAEHLGEAFDVAVNTALGVAVRQFQSQCGDAGKVVWIFGFRTVWLLTPL